MTGKGNEAYEKLEREFAERNAALLESLIIPRAPFDLNEPLPPLKPHPRTNSWEPAARRYRDIDDDEASRVDAYREHGDKIGKP